MLLARLTPPILLFALLLVGVPVLLLVYLAVSGFIDWAKGRRRTSRVTIELAGSMWTVTHHDGKKKTVYTSAHKGPESDLDQWDQDWFLHDRGKVTVVDYKTWAWLDSLRKAWIHERHVEQGKKRKVLNEPIENDLVD